MKKIAMLSAVALVLVGCFSPWQGETGTFTVSIGSPAENGRAVSWNPEYSEDDLTHEITLSGGPGPEQMKSIIGVQTVHFSVTPGNWDISVEAYAIDGNDNRILIAVGSAIGVDIRPGPNEPVIITMEPPAIIVPGANLADKLEWLQTNAQSDNEYAIEVDTNESIPNTTFSYGERTNIGITLVGTGGERIINSSTTYGGTFLFVGNGVTLTLDYNITLKGRDSASGSVVSVNSGGTLVMNTGSSVIDNKAGSGGSGVLVNDGGTFTMNGGKVSGNKTTNGGGVSVLGGTFTMNGGNIHDNLTSNGGGVEVLSGTFTMNGGNIYNNKATQSIGGGCGGGVYVSDATFIMNGGKIYGNETGNTSGDTVNGRQGGGVYVSGGIFRIVNGTICGSDAGTERNTSYSGAVLYVDNAYSDIRGIATAEYGTFNGSAWNQNGSLDTTDNTIRVVNGELIGNLNQDEEDFGPNATIHDTFNVGTFTEWDSAVSAITSGGNDKNYIINFTASFSIQGKTTATFGSATGIKVSLRGAGNTLTRSSVSNYLIYGGNQSVILRDLTLTSSGQDHTSALVYINGVNGGTFTMHSGEITGNIMEGANARIAGVLLSNGTFTMNGGKISNNTGIGVFLYAPTVTFTMNGGEISGNTGSTGGVRIDTGTFIMNGGEISRNTGGEAGGVYVGENVNNAFIMNGGKITGNIGRGVFVGNGTFTMNDGEISDNSGGGVNTYNGTFNMYGGGISGNKADAGGGVYVENGTFTMYGGTIFGNEALGASGDTGGGGVYVWGGTFQIVTGTIYGLDDDALKNITANGGAALKKGILRAVLQYGTFNGSTWNSNGNLDTTDNTIRVLNGELQ